MAFFSNLWTSIVGLWGQVAGYVVAALVFIALAVSIYFAISYNAKQTQLLQDQKIQLEQYIKNQEKFVADTKLLLEDQKKLEQELNKTIQTITTTNDKLDEYLNSSAAAKADRSSSETLKEVIKQLKQGR